MSRQATKPDPRQSSFLPQWSIVCVVRNQAQDLQRWMRQAMQSKDGGWEMIIADAGSTDGSFELAAALTSMEPRIRLLPKSNAPWLEVLRQAADHTLGDFVLVQFPGAPLPNLDCLATQVFDRTADVVDVGHTDMVGWPACRRGYWIHSAIDAAAHQPADKLTQWLAQEGARVAKVAAMTRPSG